MIARLRIKDAEIRSAVLEQEGGRFIQNLPFAWDHFEWAGKWHVGLEYEGIECVSSRSSKFSDINRLIYHVSYNGSTSSVLLDDCNKKVTHRDRVFRTLGNFDGTLNLIWNANGHRWAEFISDEYQSFLSDRKIDWVVREKPAGFGLDIKGRFIESHIGSGENFNSWFNRRRGIVTDGEISVDSIDNYSCRIHTDDSAKYLILQKRHVESGKIQRVIYLPGCFLDAEVPRPEEYDPGIELERTVPLLAFA